MHGSFLKISVIWSGCLFELYYISWIFHKVFEIENCMQSQSVAVYHWLCAYDLLFSAFFRSVTDMHLNRMRQKHPRSDRKRQRFTSCASAWTLTTKKLKVSYFSPAFELTYSFFEVEINCFSIEITKHNPDGFEMLCLLAFSDDTLKTAKAFF